MGISKNNISHTPEGHARPSLLSTGAPSADHNILDAMAARADTPARTGRRWWMLLPLIAATLWAITTQLAQPPVVAPAAQSAPQAVTEAVKPPAPPTAEATPAASVASTTPAQEATAPAAPAAQNQNNPFSGLEAPATSAGTAAAGTTSVVAMTPSTPPRDTSTRPAFDLQAALDDKPQRATAPPKAKPTPAKPATTEARTSTRSQKTTAAAKPAASPATAKTAQNTRKSATPASQTSSGNSTRTANAPASDIKKGATARDPDVELLNAIMKHLNEGKGSAPATAPARSLQTIAELVRSCKTQDSIDALLCQRRICEGSWGKAEACPISQAPQTAKAQANH